MELESFVIGLLVGLLLPFGLPKLLSYIKNRGQENAD